MILRDKSQGQRGKRKNEDNDGRQNLESPSTHDGCLLPDALATDIKRVRSRSVGARRLAYHEYR
jgi:hypothetical protein